MIVGRFHGINRAVAAFGPAHVCRDFGQTVREVEAALGIIVQDLMGKAAGQSGISGGSQVSDFVTRLEHAGLRAAKARGRLDQLFWRK